MKETFRASAPQGHPWHHIWPKLNNTWDSWEDASVWRQSAAGGRCDNL